MIPERFGRYEVKRLLGEGGFGKVWLARDPLLSRDVAVKVPHGAWLGSAGIIAEARALARLAHPAVVAVLDAGVEGDAAYIVLEHVDGLSLEGVLLRSKGTAAPARAAEILRDPATGIDHAHSKGILHGDLKPGNLLAPLKGPVLGGLAALSGGLKVADLGLLALEARAGVPLRGAGDPRYAAPEAWSGQPTRASDVHALAAVFFHLVAGEPPVVGTPQEIVEAVLEPRRRLSSVVADALPELDEALARALSLDPTERPVGAVALVDSLEAALAEATEARREVKNARERIAAREADPAPARASCPSCRFPLHPRATECARCGEVV